MRKELDLESWNRKEHFQFFSSFDEPFFGIVANLDCTIAYQEAKNRETSFFLYYLHKTLQAVNAIEEMRYRIEDGKVYVYDWIHASPTLSRADHTLGLDSSPTILCLRYLQPMPTPKWKRCRHPVACG